MRLKWCQLNLWISFCISLEKFGKTSWQCVSFAVPSRECNYWEVGLLFGNVIQSRLGKTWGCLCEPAKLCGRWEYMDKHHTPRRLGQRETYALQKWLSEILTHENHSICQGFWASEICTRLRPDKDQLFAIMFADLFLIEPPKKSETRWWRCFFPRDSVNCRWATIFCVVKGGWNDVDNAGKMIMWRWSFTTFRCFCSVQREGPNAGMLQVYHESWQKHRMAKKHPAIEQSWKILKALASWLVRIKQQLLYGVQKHPLYPTMEMQKENWPAKRDVLVTMSFWHCKHLWTFDPWNRH